MGRLHSAGSMEFSEAHVAAAEAVLGQRVPRGALDGAAATDPSRINIFYGVPALALQAIEHELGHEIADPDAFVRSPLTPNEQSHMQRHPVVSMVATRLAMANEIYRPTRSLALPPMADVGTARARIQDGITGGLREHMLSIPSNWFFKPELSSFDDLSDVFATIAATAIGKTTLIARLLRMSGVGKTHIVGGKKRPILAAVTLPTQRLVDQFAGETGDMTFLDFLGPGIKVSKFFGKKHDADGDVVLTTPNSAGKLDLSRRDIVCGDEGHGSMSPRDEEIIAALTGRLFLFTATKAYDKDRDLTKRYRHMEINNRIDLIKQGVLNNTRLMQFEYTEDPLPLVAQLAAEYIKSGRRVIAYCKGLGRGEKVRRSEQLAAWVNDICKAEVAASVGSHSKTSDEDERRYIAGNLRMLTNTKVIREGRNLPADVGMHGDAAEWVLEQETGRIGRLGEFMSEVLQFSRKGSKGARLHHVYGLEEFECETILLSNIAQFGDAPLPGMSGHAAKTEDKSAAQPPPMLPIEAFPRQLQEQLMQEKPVCTITIAGQDFELKAGTYQLPSTVLAREWNAPLVWLHQMLDSNQIPYEGVWMYVDGREKYHRMYGPEAEAFATNYSIAERAANIVMTESEIASLYRVPQRFVRTTLAAAGQIPETREGLRSAILAHGPAALFAIEKAVDALPLAEKTDVTIGSAAAEYSSWFVEWYCAENKIILAEKRRNSKCDYDGICRHFDAAQIAALREAYQNTPEATEIDMSLYDIVHVAGVSLGVLDAEMSAEEHALVYPRHDAKQSKKPLEHVPRSIGEAIIERIEPEKLNPYLVPHYIIIQRVERQKACMKALREGRLRADAPAQMLRLVKSQKTKCSSWQLLQLAEQEYGLHPDVRPLDYDKLPRSDADTDPDRLKYAQSIQGLYVWRRIFSRHCPNRPVNPNPGPKERLNGLLQQKAYPSVLPRSPGRNRSK